MDRLPIEEAIERCAEAERELAELLQKLQLEETTDIPDELSDEWLRFFRSVP